MNISPKEALQRLINGNKKYLNAGAPIGDVSPQIRKKTFSEGQHPYAVIVTCSDSRVIPESIFSAGLGELFVIRSAGFTIDKNSLGSIEYAAGHLGVNLVVVMGHTQCGAVGSAMKHAQEDGNLKCIIDEISLAIGNETDSFNAVKLNVLNSCCIIDNDGLDAAVVGAVYHTDSGKVEFW